MKQNNWHHRVLALARQSHRFAITITSNFSNWNKSYQLHIGMDLYTSYHMFIPHFLLTNNGFVVFKCRTLAEFFVGKRDYQAQLAILDKRLCDVCKMSTELPKLKVRAHLTSGLQVENIKSQTIKDEFVNEFRRLAFFMIRKMVILIPNIYVWKLSYPFEFEFVFIPLSFPLKATDQLELKKSLSNVGKSWDKRSSRTYIPLGQHSSFNYRYSRYL